jgi:hypothetical protein
MSGLELSKEWDIPEGLSPAGFNAAVAFRQQAVLQGLANSGGCKVFYSPQEWRERGESYGCESELVVVYDGSEARYLAEFNPGIEEVLARLNLFIECCTHWYAAVYKI